MSLGFPIFKMPAVLRTWTRLSVASADARSKARRAADIKCTGTNDQNELMTAVAGLSAGGGRIDLAGNVFVAGGRFGYEKDCVTIVGEGAGSESGAAALTGTVLRAASGFPDSEVLRIKRADDTRPVRNCQLRDFTIDGNNQASVRPAVLYAYESEFTRLWTVRGGSDGCLIRGYAGWSTYNTAFWSCRSYENGGHGLVVDVNGTDLHLYGFQAHNNDLDNLHVLSGNALLAAGGHLYTPGRHNICFNGGGGDSQLTGGLRLEGAGQHNILIDTTLGGNVNAIQIKAIRIRNASTSSTGVYSNVVTTGATGFSSLYIADCHILADADTATDPAFGVRLSSSCQNATIIDNHFSAASAYASGVFENNTTGSTQAFVRRNKGVRDQGWGGTASIPSGSTTTPITWPTTLDYTPDAAQVSWFVAGLSTNPPGDVRLVSLGPTGGTVGCRSDPGASGLNVNWKLNNK